MWFKNIHLYRFNESIPFDQIELEEKLKEQKFQPCARQSKESMGWISPLSRDGDDLVYEANKCFLFAMRREQKVIPPSMVNELLEERIAEIEMEQGRKVFRKERQQFKEDILALLLPKAFTRSTHTHAYFDTQANILAVNAASSALADTFISLLIESLGTLGAVKLDSEPSPSLTMNGWLTEQLPENLELTGEYELKDPQDERTARFKDTESSNDIIVDLIADGFWTTKLGVQFEDIFKCNITDKLQIKSIKYTEQLLNQNDELDLEDATAKFDADFVLMSSSIRAFYQQLKVWFPMPE
ncbi:MAG: recombination-associated protein RdgC [Gammaproteobacteria bacterium]|nr:recombination-associated protein RdgC [Gammaproteobacteria bacterium]